MLIITETDIRELGAKIYAELTALSEAPEVRVGDAPTARDRRRAQLKIAADANAIALESYLRSRGRSVD